LLILQPTPSLIFKKAIPKNSPNPFPTRSPNLKGIALNDVEKTWLANEVLLTETPCKTVAGKYSLARTTLQGWVKTVKSGVIKHLTAGRPPRVDTEAMAEVVSQVTDQEYQMPVKDFNELFYQKAVESAARRGVPRSMVPPISRYTISNYEKIIGAKRKSSESTTWARADAQADIRKAVSFAVMNSLMEPLTEPDLIIISDATQCTVGGGAKRVQVIMISQDEAQKGPIKSKPQKSDGGLMAYFVKHYATVSAMGCSATPVFIATDDNMKVDNIDVYAEAEQIAPYQLKDQKNRAKEHQRF
jgi:hypothetical protein